MMIRLCRDTNIGRINHRENKPPETIGRCLLEELGRCLDNRLALSDNELQAVAYNSDNGTEKLDLEK